MQKDVIYIDTEDDITAIIGKVKQAKNKIVALVPPKRIGVLQSAVNLKLLQKAADGESKRVVLISNDHSLLALAAGVKMPVAKNLQSKPEVPNMEAPAAADEEVINGESLPVGDFAKSIGMSAALKKDPNKQEVAERAEIGEVAVESADPKASPIMQQTQAGIAKLKSKAAKIPDFGLFRKRIFLFGFGGLALIGFLVWAIVIAPKASVVIKAKTSTVNIDKVLSLDPAKPSDPAKLQLKSVVQQVKKPVVVEFDATGSKDVGNKANGSITIRNCDYSDGFNLPAGSRFTASSGEVFVSTKAVSVPQYSGLPSACTLGGPMSGKADVTVEAATFGPEYNIGATAYTVNGVAGKVDGVGTAMAGGTRETVKVVSQEDVDKAKQQLPSIDQNATKNELKKMFKSDQITIDESYEVAQGPLVSAPNVGEPATKAKLTQETTFTITGLTRADLLTILKSTVDDALKNKPNQQSYSYGEDKIVFQSFQRMENNTATTRMSASASIGPKIDSKELARQLAGKRFGEIQDIVNQIEGVDSVDIKFEPFWVNTAPKAEKIDIKFSIANE